MQIIRLHFVQQAVIECEDIINIDIAQVEYTWEERIYGCTEYI